MAEVAKKILVPLREDNPAIHEDTSGTLPAARLAYTGEHGDPTTATNEPSVVSYDPSTDDAPQWHPLSDLIKAAPTSAMTGGTTVCPAASLEYEDLEDPGWQDIASAAIGGGSGRMTVSASVPLSLDSPGNTVRDVAVRLVIDGYPTASQTYAFATDSTGGNTYTFTFPSAVYSVGMLAVHRVRVQVDRAPGDAAAVVYTAGPTVTITVQEGEPLTTGGDLSGPTDNALVVGLYGRALDSGTPAEGDVYAWDGSQWALTTVASPITHDGDMIYGSGRVEGAPGDNVALPANATITANATVTGAAANIIDSDDATSWRGLTNGYFTMDFGAVPPLVRGWRVFQNGTTSYRSTSVALQGSNDNSTYTTIDTWTTGGVTDSGTRDLGADYTYRYWRMRSASATLGWQVHTAEIFESSLVLAQPTRLPLGTAGQILAVNDTETAPEWVDNFATEMRVSVKNSTGSTLYKGQAVYISGAVGSNPLVSLADATTDATSSKTLGLLHEDLDNGDVGYVVVEGTLVGVDTDAASAEGVSVWLSETPGEVVFGAPPAKPAHSVYLGVVVRKHATVGEIEIKVQNGYELNELHDVNTAGVDDGYVLTYDLATGFWVAAAPSGGGADATSIQGTPVSETDPTTANQAIVYDGTEYRPYRLKASDLATILTPIFNEDGTVVFDEDGVILAEVNN